MEKEMIRDLKNITGLYYYFYSIGNGAIGISFFKPVTEKN